MSQNKTSRRHFLKRAGAALAAGTVGAAWPASASGNARVFQLEPPPPPTRPRSPNDNIRIATIGIGIQGTNDTHAALRVPGVELVAVADVYQGRLIRAKEVFGNHLFTTRDYREILARSDIDAVIIATPDHWHAQIAIDAMNAGKDVYVEKPMVQQINEGLRVIETARKTGRILQVGSQRVSSIVYAKAKELLAAGVIGELNYIDVYLDRNSAIGAWQYSIPPDATPENIDWDRFLGRAPKRPFEPIRLFRWRNYRDYGTGIPGDLFVHLFSGIHFILDSLGPTRVMATGGLRYWKDGRDVPDIVAGLFDYPQTDRHPAFNVSMRVNFASGGSSESSAFRFIGPDGVLTLDRGVTLTRAVKRREPGYTIDTFPKAVQEEFLKQYRAQYPPAEPEVVPQHVEAYVPPPGYSDSVDHFRNFFDCVRNRKQPVEDAVFGFRAAAPSLLANMSYFDGRPYLWDPQGMRLMEGGRA
ncbi:MAG TPA: Gfo/Idh/MocA family oxidoreductase [Longimicrobiales bacterium]